MQNDLRASTLLGSFSYLTLAIQRFISDILLPCWFVPMKNECELVVRKKQVRNERKPMRLVRRYMSERNREVMGYENARNAKIPLPILATPKVRFI